jgi:hypothetical protein
MRAIDRGYSHANSADQISMKLYENKSNIYERTTYRGMKMVDKRRNARTTLNPIFQSFVRNLTLSLRKEDSFSNRSQSLAFLLRTNSLTSRCGGDGKSRENSKTTVKR